MTCCVFGGTLNVTQLQRGSVSMVWVLQYELNEWMNECLYYDIWQTADEITTNAYKMS